MLFDLNIDSPDIKILTYSRTLKFEFPMQHFFMRTIFKSFVFSLEIKFYWFSLLVGKDPVEFSERQIYRNIEI
jgi:hypothetical protein